MDHRLRYTHEEMRSRILDKADELVRQYGFTKITVADIASDLNMSPANIYKYFTSKDALIEACAERAVLALKDQLLSAIDTNEPAVARLNNLVAALVRHHRDCLSFEQKIYKLILASIEQDWQCIRRLNDDIIAMIKRIIDDGINKNEFNSTNSEETAVTIYDCIRGVTHPLLLFCNDLDIDHRASSVVNLVGRALR